MVGILLVLRKINIASDGSHASETFLARTVSGNNVELLENVTFA